MTRPTAPMLQAEYHNYNEQNAFNDYYGGYDPKASSTWNTNGNGPRRMEMGGKKGAGRCRTGDGNTGVIHCLNALVVARSIAVLVVIFMLINSGYQHEYVLYVAGFEALCIVASIAMCCGIELRQPFLCILFTVFRTMEATVTLVISGFLAYAIWDKNSEIAKFIRLATKDLARQYAPGMNIGWDDLAFQITIALLGFSLLITAISVFFCRVSWSSTMWATDERKRIRATQQHEVSRDMVASDELYTNY